MQGYSGQNPPIHYPNAHPPPPSHPPGMLPSAAQYPTRMAHPPGPPQYMPAQTPTVPAQPPHPYPAWTPQTPIQRAPAPRPSPVQYAPGPTQSPAPYNPGPVQPPGQYTPGTAPYLTKQNSTAGGAPSSVVAYQGNAVPSDIQHAVDSALQQLSQMNIEPAKPAKKAKKQKAQQVSVPGNVCHYQPPPVQNSVPLQRPPPPVQQIPPATNQICLPQVQNVQLVSPQVQVVPQRPASIITVPQAQSYISTTHSSLTNNSVILPQLAVQQPCTSVQLVPQLQPYTGGTVIQPSPAPLCVNPVSPQPRGRKSALQRAGQVADTVNTISDVAEAIGNVSDFASGFCELFGGF